MAAELLRASPPEHDARACMRLAFQADDLAGRADNQQLRAASCRAASSGRKSLGAFSPGQRGGDGHSTVETLKAALSVLDDPAGIRDSNQTFSATHQCFRGQSRSSQARSHGIVLGRFAPRCLQPCRSRLARPGEICVQAPSQALRALHGAP